MILANLPVLQVIIPLIAAPICAMLPSRRIAWFLVCAVTAVTFIISLSLAYNVFNGQPVTYEMGGWGSPVISGEPGKVAGALVGDEENQEVKYQIGIQYRVDLLSAFILMLISGVAAITSVYSFRSVDDEIDKPKQPLFYATFLLCFTGLLGITITNDAFNIYVFLEISSLATYALIGMGKDRRALLASFEYLVLGTIGATFILIAIGLLYMMTGTLNISDLAIRVPGMLYMTPIKAALAFFTVGLALKIAIFPLHLWLANSYTNAPSFVSVFLSATATKVGIYVLVRLIFFVFGYQWAFNEMHLGHIFTTLSVVAIFACSLVAIYQKNIKRMLAYSSVAQIGYIMLGISLMNELGNTAALIHLFNHAIAKSVLFMAVGCVALRVGGVRIENFKGVGSKMPLTMAAFLVAGFSIIGVPMTGGFISKWFLLSALADRGMWPIFVAVIASSLLALVYIWRIVEVAYFQEPEENLDVKEAPFLMLLPMWFMTAMVIVFGVYTVPVVDYAMRISEYLFSL